MDALLRADQFTAHICDPIKRERVRKNLLKQFKALDAIRGEDDEESGEIEPYICDGRDGVPIITEEELLDRERAKLGNLRDLHKDLRRDEDDEDTAENDVNKKGRYGYTPLHLTIVDDDMTPEQKIAAVKSLLERNARTDIEDASGLTVLQRALMRKSEPGMKEIIKMLQTVAA